MGTNPGVGDPSPPGYTDYLRTTGLVWSQSAGPLVASLPAGTFGIPSRPSSPVQKSSVEEEGNNFGVLVQSPGVGSFRVTDPPKHRAHRAS